MSLDFWPISCFWESSQDWSTQAGKSVWEPPLLTGCRVDSPPAGLGILMSKLHRRETQKPPASLISFSKWKIGCRHSVCFCIDCIHDVGTIGLKTVFQTATIWIQIWCYILIQTFPTNMRVKDNNYWDFLERSLFLNQTKEKPQTFVP